MKQSLDLRKLTTAHSWVRFDPLIAQTTEYADQYAKYECLYYLLLFTFRTVKETLPFIMPLLGNLTLLLLFSIFLVLLCSFV